MQIDAKIQSAIDAASVVSFDVFDTLIVRPFAAPRDLFLLFGKDFWIRRCVAEKEARAQKKEPTLCDIYRLLPDDKKEAEIDAEIKCCKPRPEIVRLLDYARGKNKKVVLVSDMYLPKNVIHQMLDKCGVKYDCLYVSCEYGKSKTDGLFGVVLADLGIRPEQVLHFGDNCRADIDAAGRLGIRTQFVPKLIDMLMERYPRLKLQGWDRFPQSHWLGLVAMSNRPYWEQIGYKFGVFLLAYCQWIKEQVELRGIRDIAFVARDGWLLKQIYERLDTKSKCHYVYANRHMLSIGKDYTDYYKSLGLGAHLAIVDTLTIRHSAYRLIGRPDALLICVIDKRRGSGINSISYNKAPALELDNWDFFELLITSPEPPVVDVVDGKPVYASNEFEEQRIEVVKQIHKGVLDFCDDVLPIRFIFRDVQPMLNNFFEHLSREDKAEFDKIRHSPRSDHSEYRRIFNV